MPKAQFGNDRMFVGGFFLLLQRHNAIDFISPSLKNISPNWNSNLYLNIMWLTQNISSVIHLNYFTHFKLSTHLNCNLWFALEFLGKIRIWYCNNINFSLVLLLGLQWLLVVCLNNVVSVFCRGYM